MMHREVIKMTKEERERLEKEHEEAWRKIEIEDRAKSLQDQMKKMLQEATDKPGHNDGYIAKVNELMEKGANPKILFDMCRAGSIDQRFAATLMADYAFLVLGVKNENGVATRILDPLQVGDTLGFDSRQEIKFKTCVVKYSGTEGEGWNKKHSYNISMEDLEFLFALRYAKAVVMNEDYAIAHEKRTEICGKIDELISHWGDKGKKREVLKSCKELRDILSECKEQNIFNAVMNMLDSVISLIENAMQAMFGKYTQALEQESQSKAEGVTPSL